MWDYSLSLKRLTSPFKIPDFEFSLVPPSAIKKHQTND
jgi:hypothetical protein